MKERTLIEKNEKAKINHTAVKQLNKDKGANSCNSCGLCNRLRSPHLSSESVSIAMAQAKSLGKESCAISFIQRNYGNAYMQRIANNQMGNFGSVILSVSKESQKTQDSSVVSLSQNDIIGQPHIPPSTSNKQSAISHMPSAISRLQKKCSCGGNCPSCKGEEEAERVSMSIMRMPSKEHIAYSPLHSIANSLQLYAIGYKPYAISHRPYAISQHDEQAQISEIMSNKGSGHGLDDNTRSFMEDRFGYDFSHVRLHTDSYAARKSSELNAEAFTIGRDIFFNAGRYNPGTSSGKRLLAHELTHVMQQQRDNLRRNSSMDLIIQRAICVHPPALDLSTVNAPPIGESGSTITLTAPAGKFTGHRIQHRVRINNKHSFISPYGQFCECIDVASYRIEIYEIEWNPFEWVSIHMSARRRCCSTQAGTEVNQACRGIPGGFEFQDTYEGGEAFFFDPTSESDRDLLSDVGSAASILGVVLAVITIATATPGVPPPP